LHPATQTKSQTQDILLEKRAQILFQAQIEAGSGFKTLTGPTISTLAAE